MGRVIYCEIPVGDFERAEEFFSKTFGWKVERQEMDWGTYHALKTGDQTKEGINGSLYDKSTVPPENARVINVISVDDIDSQIEKIETHGGEMVFKKLTIKGVGYLAYFKDPGGNILGIMQSDTTAGLEEDE